MLSIGLLLFLSTVNTLEVDILDSFNLKDGQNGVQATTSCKVGNGYYFGRTSNGITAVNEVLKEVVELFTQHHSFIITFKVRPEPYHKGSILWLEQKRTATPLFGLWMRSGKTGKYGLQFYGKTGVEYVTLQDTTKYDDVEWHTATLHFHKQKKKNLVSLYVNCKLVDKKKARVLIKNGPKDGLELRLGQREIAGKIFSRFKGSLTNFRLIFQRNISTYLQQNKCKPPTEPSYAPPAENPFKNLPFKSVAGATATTRSILSSLSANEISSIFRHLENHGNNVPSSSKLQEIVSLLKDVRARQDNQVFEMKSLKELVLLGGRRDNVFQTSSNQNISSACSSSPCYPFVTCVSTGETFTCGKCPVGLEGDGVNCKDINECDELPCSSVSRCENKFPGYMCHACPKGYHGEEVIGIGREFARLKKQECTDIDECKENLHSCDKHSKCTNTPGGFKCGNCNPGFKKNRQGKCLPVEVCTGKDVCSVYATCERSVHGARCTCRAATAGDGYVCGNDQDGDGYPDVDLNCDDAHCKKDNCPSVPNSGQEDVDGDGEGDACDVDIDGDGIHNAMDNCPYVANKGQTNSDSDEHGDECDNCMFVFNPDQEDHDQDGKGDVCDRDMDGDGELNFIDNCKTVKNADQMDRDKDGAGDVCDNCPDTYNPKQKNIDGDRYGDKCDNDIDNDKDGHIDKFDNCPHEANADQLDTDSDGKGDACDDDDDGDGVADNVDNCHLVANPAQSDFDGDGVGDVCQGDEDGDGKLYDDTCPQNKYVFTTDFTRHDVVLLGTMDRQAQKHPKWALHDQGREMVQERNSAPSLILSKDSFNGFDFTGSVFVNTRNDDDFIGFAFGFQNVRKFYLLSWKQKTQSYWRSKPSYLSTAKAGIELKYIHSSTGQSFDLRAAIWHSGNVTNQVTQLWRDKAERGWEDKVPYKWFLMHRPSMGLIRLKVYRRSAILLDTGYIIHNDIKGGQLGPYSFSQSGMIWSDVKVTCNEEIPEDILAAIQPKKSN
ncbi:cartilage oligomeric matrix protein-like isoform X1 [Hydractinia symbiolongicarpus]|uniref:cartilage oligomeric matrix protein-like isoform X1 n=1 Tax=Hydractinia symbiolongicarpus TaxID=13093 RepID=UPI00254D2B88|nr:cartilage oligomeric matrix protein-like isoform X1 [Hydractinia symbiolongicarpus]